MHISGLWKAVFAGSDDRPGSDRSSKSHAPNTL